MDMADVARLIDDAKMRITVQKRVAAPAAIAGVLFSLRKGTTLTKEMFLNHLYGGMDEPEMKIIDVFICKLRKKLAQAGATNLIGTVWGRGYMMRDPNSQAAQAASSLGVAGVLHQAA